MAITPKARKTLWARSGNQCSMCKTVLVKPATEVENSIIVGEECHIISKQSNGPRFESIENFDYDSENNLLLLCANCHKTIDEHLLYYTKERVRIVKLEHEAFIRKTFESKNPEILFPEIEGITLLPKVESGKALYQIILDVMGTEFDFEETNDRDENDFISSTFQNIMDYADYLGMVVEVGQKLAVINYLNEILVEISNREFVLFGEKRNRPQKFKNGDVDDWPVATLFLMKNSNPNILNLSGLTK